MINYIKNILLQVSRDTEGSTLSVFAITLPVLIGALAISVEAGYWFKSKSDVQLYADMAAYAGALELQTATSAEAKTYAKLDALNNGFDFRKGSITVHSPPITGAYQGEVEAIEVVIVQGGLKFFSGIVSDESINYRVRSVAAVITDDGGDVCVVALNETDNSSINIAGNTVANLDGCTVHSNSSAGTAIAVKGNPDVTAKCISAVGGVSGSYDLECDDKIENSDPIPDPFENINAPNIAGASCETPDIDSDGVITMEPGVYCDNIKVSNEMVFNTPGTYVFNNADININKNAFIHGEGITIILMNGSAINGLNGNAVIQVSAATTGTYRGVVIFSDPVTQPADGATTFKGDDGSYFEGLLYYPSQNLAFGGNGVTDADCTLIVANKVFMSGTSSMASSGCKENFGLVVPGASGETAVYIVE